MSRRISQPPLFPSISDLPLYQRSDTVLWSLNLSPVSDLQYRIDTIRRLSHQASYSTASVRAHVAIYGVMDSNRVVLLALQWNNHVLVSTIRTYSYRVRCILFMGETIKLWGTRLLARALSALWNTLSANPSPLEPFKDVRMHLPGKIPYLRSPRSPHISCSNTIMRSDELWALVIVLLRRYLFQLNDNPA